MKRAFRALLILFPALLLSAAAWISVDAGVATGAPDDPTTTTTAPATTATPGEPTGKIFMVKIFVGDIKAAEKFYGDTFGTKLVFKVGTKAHVETFPGGFPGLILIKAGPKDKNKYGAFVVQVPDLEAAKALAVKNGAKVQQNFSGNPGGQAAKSVDLLDPWGNQIEILQIG